MTVIVIAITVETSNLSWINVFFIYLIITKILSNKYSLHYDEAHYVLRVPDVVYALNKLLIININFKNAFFFRIYKIHIGGKFPRVG
jgi:hypothetical protein